MQVIVQFDNVYAQNNNVELIDEFKVERTLS